MKISNDSCNLASLSDCENARSSIQLGAENHENNLSIQFLILQEGVDFSNIEKSLSPKNTVTTFRKCIVSAFDDSPNDGS